MKDVGLEIKNLNNLINRNFKNLSEIKILDEITGSNGYILTFLIKNEEKRITQKYIEQALGITRSTASTVLSRMEKKDLIIRKTLEEDSRIKEIKITEKGRELHFKVSNQIQQFEQTIVQDFTKEELEMLFSFIERMKSNVEGGNKK